MAQDKLQKLELTWIGKDEKREAIEPRILIEDPNYSYGDTESGNILIHGDNLLALKALEQEYSGKIKCIYIDPPYNTGAAFEHYDDNIEHSIWLQLMYKRLIILRNLLSDDGFLCCQIDDSEGFYLKVLLDEIFGRNNYLTTLYIQVRYPNKTLAEDSDYQKIIEQCHVYAKQKNLAKLNRPRVEYDISKFKWSINEISQGEEVVLGGKKVVIFKEHQYSVVEIPPCLDGLKETWATGSLARVKASAGEFFELHLSNRKEIDGLGCLYKVYGIGEDSLGYRYISGPKKATASKGKFYSGIPIKRLEELKSGKSYKYLPVSNFYDFAGAFGNCRLEGAVDFKGGKKPESLLKMILDYYSNPGDLILDSFLGSGTTAAVAQKMGRRYIGIELGNQAYTHSYPRLKKVTDGNDQSGISKLQNWKGGSGFKFYELAPSLLKEDKFGNLIINKEYNANMLAAAMAKQEGYTYQPDATLYWKQGQSSEHDFIYTTTQFLTVESLDAISETMQEDESLLICCTAFQKECVNHAKNITVKKIPQMLLGRCEFGKDDYSLNIIDMPPLDLEEELDDDFIEEEPMATDKSNKPVQGSLFD